MMSRTYRIGAIAAVAAGVVAAVAWYVHVAPARQVTSYVRLGLSDPDAAQFERVSFNRSTNVGCGRVNAKNAFGGYIGYTRFVAVLGGAVTFGPERDSVRTEDARTQLEVIDKELAFRKVLHEQCGWIDGEPR